MLVERETALPCELALRWSVLERRKCVAVSTMVDDLRAVQRLYEWADRALDEPLDRYLVRGQVFSRKQIYDLACFVKTAGRVAVVSGIAATDSGLSPEAFNHRWRKIELLLRWVAQMYAGDGDDLRQRQRAAAEVCERIERAFRQHRVREGVAAPDRSLGDDEWEKTQSVFDLGRDDVWPDPGVRFRNHTMVYLTVNTGLRVGELLKLTLGQIPRGHEEHIVVKRNPDDPNDPRVNEPVVKTNERELFVAPCVRDLLSAYVTRYRPRSSSSYLFLSQAGRPLSLRGARHVVEWASVMADVHLTWHRFRHTFLDRVYEGLAERPDGKDLLREIAGWNSTSSADPYVRSARQRRANEVLSAYQKGLFLPPDSRTGLPESERPHRQPRRQLRVPRG